MYSPGGHTVTQTSEYISSSVYRGVTLTRWIRAFRRFVPFGRERVCIYACFVVHLQCSSWLLLPKDCLSALSHRRQVNAPRLEGAAAAEWAEVWTSQTETDANPLSKACATLESTYIYLCTAPHKQPIACEIESLSLLRGIYEDVRGNRHNCYYTAYSYPRQPQNVSRFVFVNSKLQASGTKTNSNFGEMLLCRLTAA